MIPPGPTSWKMDGAQSADSGDNTDSWYGWPHKKVEPVTLLRPDGKTERVRTPVMDLEGLTTPTELHYVVQHFGIPDPVAARDWSLSVDGEVKKPLRLSYDDVRRFPSRSVRTVMECSGSDATYFEYFKGEGPRPSRTQGAHDPFRQRVDRCAPGGRPQRGWIDRPRDPHSG